MATPPSHTPRIPDVTPEPPGVPWRAVLKLLARLPQGALSRGLGALADTPVPGPMRGLVLGTFARAVGIDVGEAERPLDEYGSVNDFFVRRLKAGARTWPADPGLVSPVDGIVGQVGRIEDGRLIQAKGLDYAAAELLGSTEEAARFDGGQFITIYLSPKHYHRIHAPAGGTIPAARYVPGSLFPVNDAAVRHVRDLFARNERLLAHIDGDLGRVAIVAVGAYNVGRISAAFDPAWSGEGAPGGGASLGHEPHRPPAPRARLRSAEVHRAWRRADGLPPGEHRGDAHGAGPTDARASVRTGQRGEAGRDAGYSGAMTSGNAIRSTQ